MRYRVVLLLCIRPTPALYISPKRFSTFVFCHDRRLRNGAVRSSISVLYHNKLDLFILCRLRVWILTIAWNGNKATLLCLMLHVKCNNDHCVPDQNDQSLLEHCTNERRVRMRDTKVRSRSRLRRMSKDSRDVDEADRSLRLAWVSAVCLIIVKKPKHAKLGLLPGSIM